MQQFTEHTWCLWVSLAMAVGINVLWRFLPKVFGRKIPRNLDDWQYELEQVACDVIRADLAAAETKRRLIEMVGNLPADFDATAWLGVRLADHVQRAVLAEAERQGIVDASLVARVFPPVEAMPQVAPSPSTRSEPPPPADDFENVHWIDGRLHPRSASNS